MILGPNRCCRATGAARCVAGPIFVDEMLVLLADVVVEDQRATRARMPTHVLYGNRGRRIKEGRRRKTMN